MVPVLEAGLNAMQFSRKFPRDMVYGPKQAQGLGLKDPYIVQGLTWIKTLMHHGDRETVTGALLRSSLEHLQLELGSGVPFFQDDYEIWSDLATNCWLKHVWKFLQEQALRVEHTVPVLKTQTTQDAFLMPFLVQHGFSNNDLRILNHCRCYLHALTVADVLVADGSKVCIDSWDGTRNYSRRSDYIWPRTERPAERHWVMWRQALSTVFSIASNRQTEWELGPWNLESTSRWLWRYDTISGELFHREGAVWVTWRPNGRLGLRSTSLTFSKGHRTPTLPVNLRSVSVRRLPGRHEVRVTGMATFEAREDVLSPRTFHERLNWFQQHSPKDA